MIDRSVARSRLRAGSAIALVALLAPLAACTKSEDSNTPAASGSGGAQVVQSTSPTGPSCTLQQYGAPKLDLKDAVVGFSQSEKEANPFRIAETQSIRDEAAKKGADLLVTNAQSDLNK